MDPTTMPVIVVTSQGSETAAQEGVKFVAFDYIPKPCDLDDLIEIISKACKREAP
jgi:DNA-binding NtrC family response regulator